MSESAAIVPAEYVNTAELRDRVGKLEREARELRVLVESQAESLRLVLASIFRHISDDLGSSANVAATPAHGTLPSWFYAWEPKLGVTAVKCLKVLIECGPMTNQQVSMATGLSRTTVPTGLQELQKAGLVGREGNVYSLKKGTS
jgi:CRP-like cAMP-binding protein